MANLTRFTSTSRAPSPLGGDYIKSQADPGMAAKGYQKKDPELESAPFKSLEMDAKGDVENSKELNTSIQKSLKYLQQTQKPDTLYLAQAKADTQLKMNKVYMDLEANARPGGNLSGQAVGLFDEHVKNILDSSPNDATRAKILETLPGMRARVEIKASEYQNKINSQETFRRFDDTINEYSLLALTNKGNEQVLKDQIDSYANEMRKAGFDGATILAKTAQAKQNIDKSVALYTADTDPYTAQQQVKDGKYASLGTEFNATVNKRAEGVIKGYEKVAKDDVDDISLRVQNNQALPENYMDKLANAKKLGAKGVDETLQLLDLRRKVSKLSYSDVEKSLFDVTLRAKSDASISPEHLKKVENMMISTAKAMKEDPMGHAVQSGLVPNMPPLPMTKEGIVDLNAVNVQAVVNDRRQYAARASEVFGIDSIPFTQAEITQLADGLSKADVVTKVDQFKYLNQFGQENVNQIASKIAPKDPTTAMAMVVSGEDPSMAQSIVNGQQKILNKEVRTPVTEADIAAESASVFGSLFSADPSVRADMIKAAQAYAADTDVSFNEALKAVSGVIEVDKPGASLFGGDNFKTIPPVRTVVEGDHVRPFNDSDFNILVDKITTTDILKKYGSGTPTYANGTELDPSKDSAGSFDYVPYTQGKYILKKNGKTLMNADLQTPYVINLAKLYKEVK